jgi:hypothetical protein
LVSWSQESKVPSVQPAQGSHTANSDIRKINFVTNFKTQL